MDPLPLVILRCTQCPALVLLDGRVWGEINDLSPSLTLPAGIDTKFYVTLMPLRENYLPLSTALTLSRGRLHFAASGRLHAVHWTGGVVVLNMSMQQVNQLSQHMPRIVTQTQYTHYTATLYQDAQQHLALEHLGDDTLLFHHTLKQKLSKPYLDFIRLGTHTALLLHGVEENYLLCALHDGTAYRLLFESEGMFSIKQDEIEVITEQNDAVCHQRKQIYDGRSIKEEIGFFTRDALPLTTPAQTGRALLDALHLGLMEEAASYLTSELLKEMDIQKVKDFFQGHLLYSEPPLRPDPSLVCVGALNAEKDKGRLFLFDILRTEDGRFLIDNIRDCEES
ncbi:MAG: hypothetical protein ACOYJC_00675 [Christensenellales bacterium]